jgi:hypothetical protein
MKLEEVYMLLVKTNEDTYILKNKNELLKLIESNNIKYILIKQKSNNSIEIFNNNYINVELIELLLELNKYDLAYSITIDQKGRLIINGLFFRNWNINDLKELLKLAKYFDSYDLKGIFHIGWVFTFESTKDLIDFLENPYLCISDGLHHKYIIDLRKHINIDLKIRNLLEFKVKEIEYGKKWEIDIKSIYFHIIGERDEFLNKLSEFLIKTEKYSLFHIAQCFDKLDNTYTVNIFDEVANRLILETKL